MAVSVPVMIVSAFLTAEARLPVWAVFAAGWIALLVLVGRSRVGLSRGIATTDSLAERFGTFTLVVLGEVVFGAVNGLSLAHHDIETIATGMIALVVGFGFSLIYFDVVGGRLPKSDGPALANWILGHLPGAGMVSLGLVASNR